MLKIKKLGESETITVEEMKRGEIGVIVECPIKDYIDLIVQRSDNTLISLGDTEVYWNNVSYLPDSFRVRILPKGTEFVLE